MTLHCSTAGPLVRVILSRTGSIFGWSEMVWTADANSTRIVEIGALIALGFAAAARASRDVVPPVGLEPTLKPF